MDFGTCRSHIYNGEISISITSDDTSKDCYNNITHNYWMNIQLNNFAAVTKYSFNLQDLKMIDKFIEILENTRNHMRVNFISAYI